MRMMQTSPQSRLRHFPPRPPCPHFKTRHHFALPGSDSSFVVLPASRSIIMAGPAEKIKIPRNFRLLDEYDHRCATECVRPLSALNLPQTHVCSRVYSGDCDPSCSLGLKDADDMLMSAWTCSIFGPPGTAFDGRCCCAGSGDGGRFCVTLSVSLPHSLSSSVPKTRSLLYRTRSYPVPADSCSLKCLQAPSNFPAVPLF